MCRRVKKTTLDNVRAIPNQCTITKGCKGILNPVSGTPFEPSSTGLIDWYPRNKKPVIKAAVPETERISAACSDNGMLTLAMYLSDAEALAFTNMSVEFNQRLSADISTLEYNYLTSLQTSVISGKDSFGKILRFDQTAINNKQVVVNVNGVKTTNVILTPNVVTFTQPLAANTSVEVVVYSTVPSTKVYISFALNHIANFLANTSAWTNIRWVSDSNNPVSTDKKWWIYSATSFGGATSSAFLQLSQISGIDTTGNATVISSPTNNFNNARLLLAKQPYGNIDRYTQFYLSASLMASDYKTQVSISSNPTAYVEHSALVEIYPPLSLIKDDSISYSSFINDDDNSSGDSSTNIPAIVGNKILGPV